MAATGGPFGMTIGASLAAVILTFFFNRLADIDDTQTRFASAFHLSYCSHENFPLRI